MNVNDIYVFHISWPSLTQTLQLCHSLCLGPWEYSSPPFRAWFCSMAMYLAWHFVPVKLSWTSKVHGVHASESSSHFCILKYLFRLGITWVHLYKVWRTWYRHGWFGSWFRVHLYNVYNEPKPSRSPVDWPVIEREVQSLKIWCMEMSQHVLDHWSSQNSFYFPADSPTWQQVNPNVQRERLKSQCLCFSFPVLGQAIIGKSYSAWNLAWK